jgi:hypothetical protein
MPPLFMHCLSTKLVIFQFVFKFDIINFMSPSKAEFSSAGESASQRTSGLDYEKDLVCCCWFDDGGDHWPRNVGTSGAKHGLWLMASR